MTRSRPDPWLALTVIGGLAYPFLVYLSLGRVPPALPVLAGLTLIGLRMLGLRRLAEARRWLAAFALAGTALAALLFWRPALAARCYPIAISLAVAAVFALSLRFPPSVVERIARLREPDLPPEGVRYTRRVTALWVGFLLCNAAISAATALWGSLAAWTLWNGLLSYLAMGLLFAGEILVRRRVRKMA
ncbi:hypothetical protein GALL_80250 [mine drainage metagenome]|uniref:Intracellular septation protein A n=1 Tax=mine drainage metagenome TaxID=410659 RepID=A0A1J5SNP2_9ZZZZ